MTDHNIFSDENGIVYDVNYKELLFNLLHEAHTISNLLSSYSKIITLAVGGEKIDEPAIRDHAYKISESASLLSLWVNVTEFEINPSYFENQKLLPSTSLYGKYKKATINFKQIAKEKKVKIHMKGVSEALLNLYPVIDMLPYLLLDNALKYAPKESTIYIEFVESFDFIEVIVSSFGPSLKHGEIDHVFEKGFRGHEAAQMIKQGAGRGLAIAKHICDIHNAKIKVETGFDKFTLEGVTHSDFIVTVKFPRH